MVDHTQSFSVLSLSGKCESYRQAGDMVHMGYQDFKAVLNVMMVIKCCNNYDDDNNKGVYQNEKVTKLWTLSVVPVAPLTLRCR